MERGLKEAQELLVSHARGLAGCINHAKVEKTLRKIGFWTRSIDVSDIKGLPDDADKLGECVMGREKFVVLRSEEHTSELQSLMRISYAVFCFKKTKQIIYI